MTAPTPFETVKFIDRLKDACDRSKYQMAVCDLLGRKYQDDDMSIKTVDVFSPLSVRYELRSKTHVGSYNLKVIYSNYE